MVIVLFLYSLVLFAFYACKKDRPTSMSKRHKTKQTLQFTKCLVKVKINAYICKHYANVQPLFKAGPVGFKTEKDPKAHKGPNIASADQSSSK